MSRKIVCKSKVISDLEDPRGWTIRNNPHPNTSVSDPLDEDDWRNWHEWDDRSYKSIACHMCLLRAKIGSGNCLDGGPYFICLPEDVRTGKVPYKKPVITKQSTLM